MRAFASPPSGLGLPLARSSRPVCLTVADEWETSACGYTGSVRVMFLLYVVVIVGGLAVFIALGARG